MRSSRSGLIIGKKLLLIAICGLLLSLSLSAQPSSRRNGKIAFTSDRDGNREIYLMNSNGTGQYRLTNNSTVDDHATWSPDGRRIAFVGQRPDGQFAIFVMLADGSNKTEVTPLAFDPSGTASGNYVWDAWAMSWSPDATRIVFQESTATSSQLLMVNTDGTGRHVLNGNLTNARQPSWSPDGSRILFTMPVSQIANNLFTVKPDGTDLLGLASFPGESDIAGTWSPSGDKVAFQLWDWANFESILVANADGTGRTYFDSGSVGPFWGGRDKPDWSPDGSKIVYHNSQPSDDGSWDTEIFVKNIGVDEGLNGTRLTNTTGKNFKPSWQPLPLGPFDFDADGRADLSVWRPSTGTWYLDRSTAGYTAMTWGVATDELTPADYDGDGKTDIAIWRPSTGTWYFVNSLSNTFTTRIWGEPGDIPAPADFDADGKADVNVFRPSTGLWYRIHSTNGHWAVNHYGESGDLPVVSDYDGDGRADLAVCRPSNGRWYVQRSSAGYIVLNDGCTNRAPADYDGDGRTEVAVISSTSGNWIYHTWNTGLPTLVFAELFQTGDIPAPADYDGDGRADLAVFRPSTATWHIGRSQDGSLVAQQFGVPGDLPTQSAYLY